MKVVMYVHGGSKNHGCEAIIRSTARLLDLDSKQSVLLSYNQSEDLHYGLDSVVSINQEINAINKKSFDFISLGKSSLIYQKDLLFLPKHRLRNFHLLVRVATPKEWHLLYPSKKQFLSLRQYLELPPLFYLLHEKL